MKKPILLVSTDTEPDVGKMTELFVMVVTAAGIGVRLCVSGGFCGGGQRSFDGGQYRHSSRFKAVAATKTDDTQLSSGCNANTIAKNKTTGAGAHLVKIREI